MQSGHVGRSFGADVLAHTILASRNVLGRSLEACIAFYQLAEKKPLRAHRFRSHAELVGGLAHKLIEIAEEKFLDAKVAQVLLSKDQVLLKSRTRVFARTPT